MINPLKLFNKSEPQITQKKSELTLSSDTFIDTIICLHKNYEIDIKLFFDDKMTNNSLSKNEYALVCAEFLNIIMSGKLKNQLLDIIIKQIRNENNQDLIDRILKFLVAMEELESKEIDNSPLIKPSEVFAKYKNG